MENGHSWGISNSMSSKRRRASYKSYRTKAGTLKMKQGIPTWRLRRRRKTKRIINSSKMRRKVLKSEPYTHSCQLNRIKII